jgi:2-dehydro-3-deoxyphosphogluconate aldolase/(4S)-4-hydroxy-2-oxoglutarate aldolase
VISIPGAFTPTEIYQAHNFGADIIKVFPAISPEYISNILGPLSGFRLIPTGGVSVNNIGNFLRAGSFAVGVGSSLVNSKNIVNEASLRELTARAKQFCEAASAS